MKSRTYDDVSLMQPLQGKGSTFAVILDGFLCSTILESYAQER